MRSNCLAWALGQWVRCGGYFAMRRSRFFRYAPHFIWSKDLQRWYGFVPVRPKYGWWVLIVMWWFAGRVVRRTAETIGLVTLTHLQNHAKDGIQISFI